MGSFEQFPYAFLPTRPLRDATSRLIWAEASIPYFYPRVPCGTRPRRGATKREGDKRFLPTRPLRDATLFRHNVPPILTISTHASLAGRDGQHGNAQLED